MNISNCSLKDECQFVKELKNKISNMKESYETDAEAKFYDYVDKYNSKKLLTANDYVELNKNNEILMIYNQTLLKENKELKKKLTDIKQVKNITNPRYYHIKEDRLEATMDMVIVILATPVVILLDLLLLPIELMYLIIYKILWK